MKWTEVIRRIFNNHQFEKDACKELWQFIDYIERGGYIDNWFIRNPYLMDDYKKELEKLKRDGNF